MKEKREARIVLCADSHLGFDMPVRPRSERRRRGGDFFANFRRILDHAIVLRADLIVHGGDFFYRSRVPESIINRAYNLLFQFADNGIPILIVPGNHERSQLPTSLFLTHPGIHIFHQPETKLFDSAVGRLAFSGFPNVRNGIESAFSQRLTATGWDQAQGDCRFLCLHQSVEGAIVGPNDFTFRKGADVIGLDQIPSAFDALLCGHIHRRQVLAKRRDDGSEAPIIYPGSIERTSFAEKEEEKGYYLITITGQGETDRRQLSLDFIGLPARPMIDLIIDTEWNQDNLDDRLSAISADFPSDSIVRISATSTVPLKTRQMFSSEFVRKFLPETMNVQFGSQFFSDEQP
jgi:DNA repair protein SbcD/Mre11